MAGVLATADSPSPVQERGDTLALGQADKRRRRGCLARFWSPACGPVRPGRGVRDAAPPGRGRPCSHGPGCELGRRSRGRSQDVRARSRQVHVSRMANSPFRVVSAGSAPRRALPAADAARAILRSETIERFVGESPRRVTIGDPAPPSVTWRRPGFSLPLHAHDQSLLPALGSYLVRISRAGGPAANRELPRKAGIPVTAPGPDRAGGRRSAASSAAGPGMPASSGSRREGPADTTSARGQSRAR